MEGTLPALPCRHFFSTRQRISELKASLPKCLATFALLLPLLGRSGTLNVISPLFIPCVSLARQLTPAARRVHDSDPPAPYPLPSTQTLERFKLGATPDLYLRFHPVVFVTRVTSSNHHARITAGFLSRYHTGIETQPWARTGTDTQHLASPRLSTLLLAISYLTSSSFPPLLSSYHLRAGALFVYFPQQSFIWLHRHLSCGRSQPQYPTPPTTCSSRYQDS